MRWIRQHKEEMHVLGLNDLGGVEKLITPQAKCPSCVFNVQALFLFMLSEEPHHGRTLACCTEVNPNQCTSAEFALCILLDEQEQHA
jgi:hypothetical protein